MLFNLTDGEYSRLQWLVGTEESDVVGCVGDKHVFEQTGIISV